MHFQDKFYLTPEQSLFLAKKKWDKNVYCGMKMENRALTFPQMKTILNGFNVLLPDFYNTGDSKALKVFLYENAIQGMTMS